MKICGDKDGHHVIYHPREKQRVMGQRDATLSGANRQLIPVQANTNRCFALFLEDPTTFKTRRGHDAPGQAVKCVALDEKKHNCTRSRVGKDSCWTADIHL